VLITVPKEASKRLNALPAVKVLPVAVSNGPERDKIPFTSTMSDLIFNVLATLMRGSVPKVLRILPDEIDSRSPDPPELSRVPLVSSIKGPGMARLTFPVTEMKL